MPLLRLSAIVKQATKNFPLLPSIIDIRSVSDKLGVVHSSCLFGAESYSGQREGKSVWQGFQSKICVPVSCKLSKCTQLYAPYNFIYA